MMHLQEAQHTACLQHPDPPPTIREALGRIVASSKLAQEAFVQDRLVQAQTELEDTLMHVLMAMQKLEINPEQGLMRALNRLAKPGTGENNVFRILEDRVELWSDGTCRGEWPLYSQDDFDMALRMAQELGCTVDIPEAQQLDLFSL